MKKGHIKRKIKTLYKQKIIRDLLCLLLAQVAIVSVSCLFDRGTHFDYGKVSSATVTVERLFKRKPIRYNSFLCFESGRDEYVLSEERDIGGNNAVLDEVVHVGDTFNVKYVKKNILFVGEVNYVVDLRDDTQVYRSLDDLIEYKERPYRQVIRIIFWVVVEVIYAGIVFIYIWLNSYMLDFSK